MENLYPNTLYHVWIAAKSRRGEGAATPKLAVRTDQYGRIFFLAINKTGVNMFFFLGNSAV